MTIPIEIRERLGLHAGTAVEFDADGDSVRITRVADVRGRGRTIVDRLRGRATGTLSTEEIMALTPE